jgi:arylformamidase
MSKQWIDVSVPLHTGMVYWPSDPSVHIERFADMNKGAVCNVSKMELCCHAGTHMDGLNHFVKDGAALDTVPFDAVIGPCRVIEIKDDDCVKPAELKKRKLRKGERILLKTRNSKRQWWNEAFDTRFIHISKGAALHLVDCGIRTIGIDYLSVGGYQRDGVECHQIILGAGIWIIEGLDLTKVRPGKYDVICLPVKIQNSDGAPARAILRKRG